MKHHRSVAGRRPSVFEYLEPRQLLASQPLSEADYRTVVRSGAQPRAEFNGEIYFTTGDDGFLWKTDKVHGGVVKLRKINEGPLQSGYNSPDRVVGDFIVANDLLFFSEGKFADAKIWRTDGTVQGTFPLTNFVAPYGFGDLVPAHEQHNMRAAGGYVYFTQLGPSGPAFSHTELWRTDGTLEGTIKLAENGQTSWLVGCGVDGGFYFGWKSDLWRTDGTPGGTSMVVDVNSLILDIERTDDALFLLICGPCGKSIRPTIPLADCRPFPTI